MLNLLPVVMLLLVQGMGDVDPTARHQQMLLDLAQRVGAAQNREELEDLLSEAPGLSAQQVAIWIDAYYTLCVENEPSPDRSADESDSQTAIKPTDEPLPEDNFLFSARTRDGPSF